MNVQIKLQTNEKRWFEVRELSITPKLPVLLLYFVYPREFEIYFSQHKTKSARQTDTSAFVYLCCSRTSIGETRRMFDLPLPLVRFG